MRKVKNLKIWFGLTVLLTLSATVLAGDDTPFIPQTLVRTETTALVKYSAELKKYVTDCEGLRDSARLVGEQLKKCLTTLKDLRTRFDGFLQMQTSLMDKINNAQKWTKGLDDEFDKYASKRGASSGLISEVSQKGGFRSFFQTANRELIGMKGDFDGEIRELEEMVKKSASASGNDFQKVSSPLRFIFVRRIYKVVQDTTDSTCSAICCRTSCPI